jgi:hypothetical protein
VVISERKNDSTTHLHLDQEQECADDDDIIEGGSVGDVVCSSTISHLIRQLVKK